MKVVSLKIRKCLTWYTFTVSVLLRGLIFCRYYSDIFNLGLVAISWSTELESLFLLLIMDANSGLL